MTTIEGLSLRSDAVAGGFVAEDAAAVRLLHPGQIVTATALLADRPAPRAEIAHRTRREPLPLGAYPRSSARPPGRCRAAGVQA